MVLMLAFASIMLSPMQTKRVCLSMQSCTWALCCQARAVAQQWLHGEGLRQPTSNLDSCESIERKMTTCHQKAASDFQLSAVASNLIAIKERQSLSKLL